MKVFWNFLSSLSLLVTSIVLLFAYLDTRGFFSVIGVFFSFPFFLVSGCFTIQFVYALIKRRNLELWKRIMVPFFALLCVLHFLPITPYNYRVSPCNPQVRMVSFWMDTEAWRGSSTYVFRSDSMMEYRIALRERNGKLVNCSRYIRRGDSIFCGSDTFHIEGDNLCGRETSLGLILFDKDRD